MSELIIPRMFKNMNVYLLVSIIIITVSISIESYAFPNSETTST